MVKNIDNIKNEFHKIKSVLKTGDIFLAHGDSLISHLIEKLTWSEWSHSGMIIRAEDLGLENLKGENLKGELLLWESTRSTDLPDILTGNYKKHPKHPGGTFLVRLEDRIFSDLIHKEDYPFAFRILETERTTKMYNIIKEVIFQHQNAYFPDDIKFVETFLKGKLKNQPPDNYDFFFCSELIAFTFQKIGLMPTNRVPNSYEPKDYSNIFRNPTYLGREIVLS
ncbi:MAG: hypothetical protein KatS3mg129_2432 [Leptospiraceae bacterium]|nr:MAG: hypothetical protein KatS3mg129_2432 [Leptospiraceae bacterium]